MTRDHPLSLGTSRNSSIECIISLITRLTSNIDFLGFPLVQLLLIWGENRVISKHGAAYYAPSGDYPYYRLFVLYKQNTECNICGYTFSFFWCSGGLFVVCQPTLYGTIDLTTTFHVGL